MSTLRPRPAVMACVLAGLCAFAVALPGAAPDGPFSAPTDTASDQPTQDDPAVLRTRRIAIDFSRLPNPNRRRPLAMDRAVHLELFPDVAVTARFERFDDNAHGVTWVGRVDGAPTSSVTLVYSDGLLAGSVVMPGAAYQIRPAPAGLGGARPFGPIIHTVAQIDQSALPREAPPIEVVIDETVAAEAAARPLVDTAEFIDVMVVYTPAAAAHAGGAGSILNLINLGVSETNTSYANSGVDQRLRLVHSVQVDHTETSSFSASLTALRTGSGAFAGIPALRDEHRADLVTLLIHPTAPDACGVAFLLTSVSTAFSPFGYSVTDTACVSPNFTFAHELGHNMGARHDWFVDNGVTPFSYAHGYVNPALGQRWRTIMAYADLCSELGFNCTRLLFWANPDNRFSPFCVGTGFNCSSRYWVLPGISMGVPGGTSTSCPAGNTDSFTCDADDRRALNNTALTVANFRQR